MIIRGDKGDGIPNILSADNVIVDGIRQKSITEVKIGQWMNQPPEDFCNELMLRNFNRNRMLIDLTQIPETLKQSIIDTYETTQVHTKQVFLNYMIANRLTNLIGSINEF
jgi:hypothetical protein